MHFGQRAQGLFKVVNIRSKYWTIKPEECRHIYIDSKIVNVMSAAFIAPIPKIFVIKANLQLESVGYQQIHTPLA